MKYQALRLSAGVGLLLLGGCSGNGDDGAPMNTAGTATAGNMNTSGSSTGGTTPGTGGTPAAGTGGGTSSCPTAMDEDGNLLIMANEVNNYSFTSVLSFPPIMVQPDTELAFDWSAVTQDFLGHPMDPMADVDVAYVMLWKLTEQELEEKINGDTAKQVDLAIIAKYPSAMMATSANLFEFGPVDNQPGDPPFPEEEIREHLNPDPVDGFDPATHTYTLMIATGEQLGAGTRMIQAFKLDTTSTNTDVTLTTESTELQMDVDLQSLTPTQVPAGNAAITIDWSQVASNGLGNEFTRNNIGTLAVARYDRSVAELQANFLDLVQYDGSIVADDLWILDIPAGETGTLADAMNEAGANFTGIDADSTWMLALFCYNCRNPAPWYLTFLTPCE